MSPGKILGILGGGQLGRMTAQAAHRLGFRVHCYDASPDAPAFGVSHAHRVGAFNDAEALAEFAEGCDVVTYEFENLGSAQLAAIEGRVKLRPSARVLEICQNRLREKRWLRDNGFPHVPFAEPMDPVQLDEAVERLGLPCVLKTADFGYDGKGQRKLETRADVAKAREELAGGGRRVVERWVEHRAELSAIVARDVHGRMEVFPIAENRHLNHILDLSIVPAQVEPEILDAAANLARNLAARIGLVGILAVELFLLQDGTLLVNELAPRPHNSGHYTIEGCLVSQFEQHVRAVCGLPLAKPALRCPGIAMVNLLGDLWAGGEPAWVRVLEDPSAALHLYGKREARPGRKMGHLTVIGADPLAAAAQATKLRDRLTERP